MTVWLAFQLSARTVTRVRCTADFPSSPSPDIWCQEGRRRRRRVRRPGRPAARGWYAPGPVNESTSRCSTSIVGSRRCRSVAYRRRRFHHSPVTTWLESTPPFQSSNVSHVSLLQATIARWLGPPARPTVRPFVRPLARSHAPWPNTVTIGF